MYTVFEPVFILFFFVSSATTGGTPTVPYLILDWVTIIYFLSIFIFLLARHMPGL